MNELKAQLKAQQKLLEKQQAQIQNLKSALATMLVQVTHGGTNTPAPAIAVDHHVDLEAPADLSELRKTRARRPAGTGLPRS